MFLFFDISNENVGWHLRWRVFSSVISSNCELFWLTGILILFFDISNENVCWHLRWRVFSSVISSNCVLYLLTGILILFLDSRSNYVFWHPALIFWFFASCQAINFVWWLRRKPILTTLKSSKNIRSNYVFRFLPSH